jgi:signal transduction histidine kinase
MHGMEAFPFASMRQNVLSLQILLCLFAVPLLFLSAVMSEVRRTAETLRNTSGNLIDSQEQERRRISRELHDDLGRQPALAIARLDELIEESHPSVQPGLTDLSNQLSAISTTAREISPGLYPSQLEYVGLSTAVKRLCDEIGVIATFDLSFYGGLNAGIDGRGPSRKIRTCIPLSERSRRLTRRVWMVFPSLIAGVKLR